MNQKVSECDSLTPRTPPGRGGSKLTRDFGSRTCGRCRPRGPGRFQLAALRIVTEDARLPLSKRSGTPGSGASSSNRLLARFSVAASVTDRSNVDRLPVHFAHADAVWFDYPELVAGVIVVERIDAGALVDAPVEELTGIAESRLASGPESGLPEIQAWRSAFARMGLKPTQYRCAAEALLRRYRREGSLPRIHPLVDLCNAVSLAFAIPVAALDRARVAGLAEVRYATGSETYLTFTGEMEYPEPGEVIYADADDRAHARRWTNRQSGYSAVGEQTSEVLIVAEALHDTAVDDMPRLIAALAAAVAAAWSTTPKTAFPTAISPRVDF